MNETVIKIENVSKLYKIGKSNFRHDTIRDLIVDHFKSIFKNEDKNRLSNYDFWALKDVSFNINKGELVGIIGHNGAGKSTLLKILSRITEPTHGQGEIYGRVGSLLEVGTGFHPELTGRENIYLNGAIIGMRKEEIRRCFDSIVDFAEIGKFIDTPVKRYSSGMYVRLAFAVSAHLKPEILLIDEVLSVGDLRFQQKCMNYSEELRKNGSTIIFVSHNMFSIKAICNRVIYLSGGKVIADGMPQQIIPMFEKESRANYELRPNNASGLGAEDQSVHVTEMELLDESGNNRTIFRFGERMRIRFRYSSSQLIDEPNFVVAFIRSDKVACCNFSNHLDGYSIPSLYGEGTVEVLTPPLKIVSEAYSIHVLMWDKEFQHMYCCHKGLNFHVEHHLLNPHFGVFHEDGEEWQISGEVEKVENKEIKKQEVRTVNESSP